MNKLFFIFFLVSFVYPNECFNNWNKSLVSNSKNKIFHLKGVRDTNTNSTIYPLDFYFFKNKNIIRFDYYSKENRTDKIKYIFDFEKSIKIHDETNQLFITEADTNLINIFSQLFNYNILFKKIENIESNLEEYILKLEEYNFEINLKIRDCLILEQIKIRNFRDTLMDNKFFEINKLSINYLDINNYDIIFKIDDSYFEYDLRK